MQSLVKRLNICLTYFKEKLLISNTCWVFRKTSKIYTIGVYFLTKNKRFHRINWISALKPQNAKGFFNLQFNFQCWIPKNQCWNTLYPLLSGALLCLPKKGLSTCLSLSNTYQQWNLPRLRHSPVLISALSVWITSLPSFIQISKLCTNASFAFPRAVSLVVPQ